MPVHPTYLLDVNVLVALAWPNHLHHQAAHAWFAPHRSVASPGSNRWATCPLTQSGFVRVSSNQRALPEAKTPAEAVLLLRRILEIPGHVFWTDDISYAESSALALDRLTGYRQVTDAHLLALAIRHRGRLATFDRGVRDLVPTGHYSADIVALIPA